MCIKTQTETFIWSPDQHRLQEWVCPQPGAAAAARPALPSLHRRVGQRRNEVINPPACIRHLSSPQTPTLPYTTPHHLPLREASRWRCFRTSPWHRFGNISSKNPKKSGRKNFTLAGDPNSKSTPHTHTLTQPPADSLRVQMADGLDCSGRKRCAALWPTVTVILSVCNVASSPMRLPGLRNPPWHLGKVATDGLCFPLSTSDWQDDADWLTETKCGWPLARWHSSLKALSPLHPLLVLHCVGEMPVMWKVVQKYNWKINTIAISYITG